MADNRGFGAGVNAGVRRAVELGAKCFLLLNPDARISADTVTELHRTSLGHEDALVSPRLVDASGRTTFAGSVLDLRDGRVGSEKMLPSTDDPARVRWLTAACLVVHIDLWRRAGGFDEDYFMYWEDVDFCERCRQAGAIFILREDLVAVHDQGGTQGPREGRAKSSLYYYYNARNRMKFAALWLDRAAILRWLWHTPSVCLEIFLRGGRRQVVKSPTRLIAIARGAVAAIVTGVVAVLSARPDRARSDLEVGHRP